MNDDSTGTIEHLSAEGTTDWVGRTSKPSSPKLTLEALELGREAASGAIMASSDAPSYTRVGFNQEINALLIGRGIKTLADANALFDERLKQIEDRDYAHAYDRARHSMLSAFRDEMTRVMETAPSLPSR